MKFLLFSLFGFYTTSSFAADSLLLYSPDKTIKLTVHLKNRLAYSIQQKGKSLLSPSFIDSRLTDGVSLGSDLRISKTEFRTIDEKIGSPVPEKRKEIKKGKHCQVHQLNMSY